MTVSRKGKRRIVIEEREFLWWIGVNDEFFAPGTADARRVALPKGGFYVELQRGQINPERSHVTIQAKPGRAHPLRPLSLSSLRDDSCDTPHGA